MLVGLRKAVDEEFVNVVTHDLAVFGQTELLFGLGSGVYYRAVSVALDGYVDDNGVHV